MPAEKQQFFRENFQWSVLKRNAMSVAEALVTSFSMIPGGRALQHIPGIHSGGIAFMKSLTDQLANYASYHRDRRNIATHFIGIPMILFSIILLLSRPIWWANAVIPATPALLVSVVMGLYYLRLDIPLGLFMGIILVSMLKLAAPLAIADTSSWLTWGIGLFVVGWIFQSIGHIWEGKKPAFLDDIIGLIIGPLFVATELVFALGGRAELHAEITRRVGKTRVGKKAESH
jgi:uncharacterized membrane protein YGL010W